MKFAPIFLFGLLLFLPQLTPLKTSDCASDEPRYLALIQLMKTDFKKVLQLVPSEDIRHPKETETDHELYVAGPKLGLVAAGWITQQVLGAVTQSKRTYRSTFYYLNAFLIAVQGLLLFMISAPTQKLKGSQKKKHTLVRLLLAVAFSVSLPVIAQMSFFRTYNPLFGTLMLLSFYLILRKEVLSTLLAGAASALSVSISPAAPLFVFSFTVFGMLFLRQRPRNLLALFGGLILSFLFLEGLYQSAGSSFISLFARHLYENVYQNQIGMKFPYFPLLSLRYLFLFAPGILLLLAVSGHLSLKELTKQNQLLMASLVCLIVWLVGFELSPTIPLGRTMYAVLVLSVVLGAMTLSQLPRKAGMFATVLTLVIALNVFAYRPSSKNFCKFEADAALLLHLSPHITAARP